MANEIWHNYDEGNTLYAFIHRKTDDKIYDVAAGGDNFVAWEGDGSVDDYDLPLTDHDGNYYSVDFPSGISAGVYRITIFDQVAASPHADNDVAIAQGEIYWDGSAEINTFTLDTSINDDVIGADGDTLETLSDQIEVLSGEQGKTVNVYGPGE